MGGWDGDGRDGWPPPGSSQSLSSWLHNGLLNRTMLLFRHHATCISFFLTALSVGAKIMHDIKPNKCSH